VLDHRVSLDGVDALTDRGVNTANYGGFIDLLRRLDRRRTKKKGREQKQHAGTAPIRSHVEDSLTMRKMLCECLIVFVGANKSS